MKILFMFLVILIFSVITMIKVSPNAGILFNNISGMVFLLIQYILTEIKE